MSDSHDSVTVSGGERKRNVSGKYTFANCVEGRYVCVLIDFEICVASFVEEESGGAKKFKLAEPKLLAAVRRDFLLL